jgi:signal transduction histidine kinase
MKMNRMKNILRAFYGRESLSFRMFRMFLAVTIAIVVLFTSLSVYSDTRRLKDDLVIKGRTLISLLADHVRVGVFAENREQLAEAVSGVMNHAETVAVCIHAVDGRELIRRIRPGYASPEIEALLSKAPDNNSSERVYGDIIVFVEPVTLDAPPATDESIFFSEASRGGAVRVIGGVRILVDTSSLKVSAVSVFARNIIIGFLILLCGAAMVYIVLGKSLRPLKELTREVKLLGEGREIEKLSIQSRDEVGSLAAAFNEMADNLKKREQEAKELELKLRHAEKMEAVGTLARGVAHDFNNILTAADGAMFALKKQLGPDHPLFKYVYHMDNSMSRARILVQGLLVFSRGRTPGQAAVDLNDMVSKLLPMIETISGDKINCNVRLCEGPLVIRADGFQIEQVIMNLVVNAHDAMPEGGVMDIRTDSVRVDEPRTPEVVLPAAGRYAVFSLGDSGTGMPADVMERIFEPFYTTKEVGKGVGLGLSIVYGIVTDHEGGISVFSEPGRGSEFRIYLPLFEAFYSSTEGGGDAQDTDFR